MDSGCIEVFGVVRGELKLTSRANDTLQWDRMLAIFNSLGEHDLKVLQDLGYVRCGQNASSFCNDKSIR